MADFIDIWGKDLLILIVVVAVLGVGGSLLVMCLCGKFKRKETTGVTLPPMPTPAGQDPSAPMSVVQIQLPPPFMLRRQQGNIWKQHSTEQSNRDCGSCMMIETGEKYGLSGNPCDSCGRYPASIAGY